MGIALPRYQNVTRLEETGEIEAVIGKNNEIYIYDHGTKWYRGLVYLYQAVIISVGTQYQ